MIIRNKKTKKEYSLDKSRYEEMNKKTQKLFEVVYSEDTEELIIPFDVKELQNKINTKPLKNGKNRIAKSAK
jgi:hypothetical protein